MRWIFGDPDSALARTYSAASRRPPHRRTRAPAPAPARLAGRTCGHSLRGAACGLAAAALPFRGEREAWGDGCRCCWCLHSRLVDAAPEDRGCCTCSARGTRDTHRKQGSNTKHNARGEKKGHTRQEETDTMERNSSTHGREGARIAAASGLSSALAEAWASKERRCWAASQTSILRRLPWSA